MHFSRRVREKLGKQKNSRENIKKERNIETVQESLAELSRNIAKIGKSPQESEIQGTVGKEDFIVQIGNFLQKK